METQGDWKLALLGWKALGLASKVLILVIGEAKIASPHDLASHSEASIALSALAPLLEASLALLSSVPAFIEAELAAEHLCSASAKWHFGFSLAG